MMKFRYHYKVAKAIVEEGLGKMVPGSYDPDTKKVDVQFEEEPDIDKITTIAYKAWHGYSKPASQAITSVSTPTLTVTPAPTVMPAPTATPAPTAMPEPAATPASTKEEEMTFTAEQVVSLVLAASNGVAAPATAATSTREEELVKQLDAARKAAATWQRKYDQLFKEFEEYKARNKESKEEKKEIIDDIADIDVGDIFDEAVLTANPAKPYAISAAPAPASAPASAPATAPAPAPDFVIPEGFNKHSGMKIQLYAKKYANFMAYYDRVMKNGTEEEKKLGEFRLFLFKVTGDANHSMTADPASVCFANFPLEGIQRMIPVIREAKYADGTSMFNLRQILAVESKKGAKI